MQLKNKVAIVTGAKQGIGFGIASAFAKEGCNVVVSDLQQADSENAAEKIREYGVQAKGIACDVTKKEEVDNLISTTVEEFGSLDILVNNAGIFPSVPFLEMTEDDWNNVLDTNLKSIFLCTQAAIKEMTTGGKIINISSIASLVGFEGLVHYAASKSGVNGMSRALALECADKKINVNAIAPGAITTPGSTKEMTEESKQGILAAIPWKRMGTPEDIAHAAVFLASDMSDYITGQVIVVDGGWTIR